MADSLPPGTKIGLVVDITNSRNEHYCQAKVRTIFGKTVEVEYIDGPEDGRKVELPFSHFIKEGDK
jgi:hypothetical protein